MNCLEYDEYYDVCLFVMRQDVKTKNVYLRAKPLGTAVASTFCNSLLIQLLVKLLSGVICALLRKGTNTGRTCISRRLTIPFVLKDH